MSVAAILADVQYRDWRFVLGPDETPGSDEAWLQVQFQSAGVVEHGRKWRLSEHMTKSEIVQTALLAVLAAEEHEAREHFLYRGRAVFGPHFDVDELAAVAGLMEPVKRGAQTA